MIYRHITKTLERYKNSFPSIILTGSRQTGKTTTLKTLLSLEPDKYATFDDPSNILAVRNDPRFFMATHQAPAIFDEVQYVPSLFPYLKMEIDANRQNGMFFLTGSQQFELMKNVSESLAGRIGILSLYGISIREETKDPFYPPFLPSKDFILQRNPILTNTNLSLVWEKIQRGFFPELVTGNVQPLDFFPSYIKTYLERDVRNLTQVADEIEFLNFISVVAARTGQLVNYADIASTVGIDPKTAKKWLSILVSSGLVFLVHPYSGNIEKKLIKTPKLYFTDTGLAANLTKWSNPQVLASGAMAGAFFETFVVIEILKSFANAGINPPLYFYRDTDGKEIDLIIDWDGKIYPVEIKVTSSPSKKDGQNLKAAKAIKDKEIMEGILICNCPRPTPIAENITAIPFSYI